MEKKPPKPEISKEKVQEFVGRIITDEKFREKVFKNPKKAAEEAGLPLTDKQVKIFKTISPGILQELEKMRGTEVGVWVLIPIADVGVAGGTMAVGRIEDDIIEKVTTKPSKKG